jgi:proteic killer suppression protein
MERSSYQSGMIRSFADLDTERSFDDFRGRRFSSIESSARRKLQLLDAAGTLDDLRVPPGNRLESPKGNRTGQFSIRINGQWPVCFRWTDGGAEEVEIVDYH